MANPEAPVSARGGWIAALPFYYGWVNVVVASLAMTATLPGRTHGLGLVTEPLLADLHLDKVEFARINLVASLLGAAFCLPIGWLIDRQGVRRVLTGVTLALAASTVALARVETSAGLLVTLVLVRGLGQSALSIVAMAAIGKWFRGRLGAAMGAFAVLLTFGFIGSVLAVGADVEAAGWRAAWANVGLAVLALAPVFWLLARSTPEGCGIAPDAERGDGLAAAEFVEREPTVWEALATPAFWIVALGCSAFNFVWSGVTLFNESMLVERGLDKGIAVEIMAILTGTGLLANMIGGALATRARVLKLLAVGLALLAGALAAFPSIHGAGGARLYAAAIGASGGIVTVVFFAVWGHLYGRRQLGRVQGAAQVATVVASALGPEVMAEWHAATGSYGPAFYGMAIAVGLLAVAAFWSPLPRLREATRPAIELG